MSNALVKSIKAQNIFFFFDKKTSITFLIVKIWSTVEYPGLKHVIKPSEVKTYRGYTYYNYSNIQLRQLHSLHLQTAVVIYSG